MIPLLVHATDEAVRSTGVAGEFLDGLLRTDAYSQGVERTILAGPMRAADPTTAAALRAPDGGIAIRYSSLHGIDEGVDPALRTGFGQIERSYEVAILYGTRRFGAREHELLLVDATHPNAARVDDLKHLLWQGFHIESTRYAASGDYALALAIALPLLEALSLLTPGGAPSGERLLLAHDWPGLPLLLAAQQRTPGRFRTIFHAHESPTARSLIERHPGHDTRFYNALFQAREWQLGVESVFGSQAESFRHVLIRSAARCDALFAAGDLVVDELRFLGSGFYHAPIDVVYSGISAPAVDWTARRTSGQRLRDYAQALTGARPDFIFTHTGPLGVARGLWRDARVLEHLDALLRARGESALLFVHGASDPITSTPKPAERILAWEQEYGWPLRHHSGNGDLVGFEASYDRDVVDPFNARATNTRIVFVNQLGWSAALCGARFPASMQPADLILGTDVVFGQSIYEPFGGAYLAPLAAGALCCTSSVCGCVGLASRIARGTENLPNLIVADYCSLPPGYWLGSPYDALAIDQGVRDWIEGANSAHVARMIDARLPRSEAAARRLLERGAEAAAAMSWECVARDFLLPALARARHGGGHP